MVGNIHRQSGRCKKERVLKELMLYDKKDSHPQSLSGGEKQKTYDRTRYSKFETDRDIRRADKRAL